MPEQSATIQKTVEIDYGRITDELRRHHDKKQTRQLILLCITLSFFGSLLGSAVGCFLYQHLSR